MALFRVSFSLIVVFVAEDEPPFSGGEVSYLYDEFPSSLESPNLVYFGEFSSSSSPRVASINFSPSRNRIAGFPILVRTLEWRETDIPSRIFERWCFIFVSTNRNLASLGDGGDRLPQTKPSCWMAIPAGAGLGMLASG